MRHIVIFGAGKSSIYLIEYILQLLPQNNWTMTLLDADLSSAQSKIGNAPHALAFSLDVQNEAERKKHVASADIVVSLLPPAMHYLIALDCLESGKHLLTASYIDPKIEKLRREITNKRLLFLCEMGLDPGIDHMSAMKIVHSLQRQQASVISFRSHCGGLVAPESDDNPWRYKISWNPRNIVLAGKSGAVYKDKGSEIHLPYEQLFDATRRVDVDGLGSLSYYPNRDSLSYIELYKLHEASDFIRTTLRYPEFCSGWQKIIELNLTDENILYDTDGKSLRQFFHEHLSKNGLDENEYPSVEDQLSYLGLHDDDTLINKGKCSAADVLQFMLENKLALKEHDKDMIAMLHEIKYELGDVTKTLKSSLIVTGDDNVHTAMAKTVGLPLGIAAKLILQEKILVRGLHIPVISDIYEPVLAELETLGVRFTES